MNPTVERIVEKGAGRWTDQVSSGRWLLTVAGAFCFGMCVYQTCRHPDKPVISSDAITSILTAIFTFYFMKPSDGEK